MPTSARCKRGLTTRRRWRRCKRRQYSEQSAWQQRLPSIGFSGDYGVLGYTPECDGAELDGGSHALHPDFSGRQGGGGRPRGKAILKQRQAQVDNLRGSDRAGHPERVAGPEGGCRAGEVAKTGLDYAQETLTQSQDRFAAGRNEQRGSDSGAAATGVGQRPVHQPAFTDTTLRKVLLARAIGNAEQAVKSVSVGARQCAAGDAGLHAPAQSERSSNTAGANSTPELAGESGGTRWERR